MRSRDVVSELEDEAHANYVKSSRWSPLRIAVIHLRGSQAKPT
jgi:hypothetical protein